MKAVCPNCRHGPMELIRLASATQSLVLDACFPCHVFWFDRLESPALSPASTLELFKQIHEHRDAQRQTLRAKLLCPRCKEPLARTQDLQRTNRIEYHRCPKGCGRLTTFFQFLREKNFVRSLSKGEMDQLRVSVSQVRCSSCGATVAVEKDAACRHCGAVVSILDADAVEKKLAELKIRVDRSPPPPGREPASTYAYVPPEPPGAPDFVREIADFDQRQETRGWAAGGVGDVPVRDLLDDAIGGFANWFKN